MREQFLAYLVTERNLSVFTATAYNHSLERLEKYVGKSSQEVTVADVREFLRSNYSPATKSSMVVAIKAFHKWGALEGYWSLNGLMALSSPKVIHNPKPSLTRSEVAQLLRSARTAVEIRLVYLGLYAGTRVSETARIDEKCWLGDRLRFIGKGRKEREVPIHPELAKVKDIILSKKPTDNTLKQQSCSLAAFLKIPFSSHTLRRTCGVSLSEAKVSRDVIAALLGHETSVLASHYVPVRFSEMVEAINTLDYLES